MYVYRSVEMLIITVWCISCKGRGVRTSFKRNPGEYLLSYYGDLITAEKGEEREKIMESCFRYFFTFKGQEWW